MAHRFERAERLPVCIPVRFVLDGSWHDATIVNMSEHGMCLRTDKVLPIGETIDVHRGKQTAQVAIRWSGNGRHGAYSGTSLPVFNFINDHPRSRFWMGLPVVERREDPTRWPSWSQRLEVAPRAAVVAAIAILSTLGMSQAVLATFSIPIETARAAFFIGP